jgi:uncharacterized protein (DUF1501 family)
MALGISGSSFLGTLGKMKAFAQSAVTSSDYKALICVYLYGGNDSNNMLVPADNAEFQQYAETRGQLALPQSSLLPLSGGRFAVHPSMANAQSLYNAGQLAFLTNVGTLIQPLTKADIVGTTKLIPPDLMDHTGQETLMQNALNNLGSKAGWGGRIADLLSSASPNALMPLCTSTYGNNTFVEGLTTQGFLSPGSPSGALWCPINACAARDSAFRGLLAVSDSNGLVAADQSLITQMLNQNSTYAKVMSQAPPLKTVFGAGFQGQLKTVAQMISLRQTFQANRQIFYVGLGSFDTHGQQLAAHASLLQTLDSGLKTLTDALQELGVYDNVTTFTLSDFSRALQGNSAAGSDHAWGAHHIIVGGAVKGGRIYGTFPTLDPTGPDDNGDNIGRWIPTTSVSQMGSALASWFGVQSSDLNTLFPNLTNFPGNQLVFF